MKKYHTRKKIDEWYEKRDYEFLVKGHSKKVFFLFRLYREVWCFACFK